MSGIILPRIHRAEFHNFKPLFEKSVGLDLPTGPFMILGGNAIGKTTALQAIVFALAGPAGRDIEQETAYQWETDYFTPRITDPKNAEVVVEFSLGATRIGVRRGLKSEKIRALKLNKGEWLNDSERATLKYESVVADAGNYPAFGEFRYLIHRLCYLAENRRSLLWDQAAQVRALMLICGDAEREAGFREARETLRTTDTDKRHLYVDIGRLKSRIARIEAKQPEAGDKARLQPEREEPESPVEQCAKFQTELDRVGRNRMKLLRKLGRNRKLLNLLNEQLEGLQEQLSAKEEAFVLRMLRTIENEKSALALHKLLVYHRCPYCTQVSKSLAAAAARAIANGRCPICGQSHTAEASSRDLTELRSKTVASTRKRENVAQECSGQEVALFRLEQEEIALRARLSEVTLKLPRIPKEEELELNTTDVGSLEKTLQSYESRHSQLEQRCVELKKSVDQQFAAFTASCAKRLRQLQDVASEYGKEFLGDPCEFVSVLAPGELSTFNFFVPKFSDTERRTPESCSESERFFLDIAFRMALVDLAGVLSNTRGTFICETPENALDLVYTDNVADMFAKFSVREFSVLLTANIQLGGVAKPLLAKFSLQERRKRVCNLIHLGEPTQVQKDKISELDAEFKRILGEAK